MKDEIITKRYALALFRLARDEKKIEQATSSLADVVQALEQRRDFFIWLDSLNIDNKRRQDVARKVLGESGIIDMVKNLVVLLVSRERISLLPTINDKFKGLVDQSNNLIRGSIFTARKGAASDVMDEISKRLFAPLRGNVLLNEIVDKRLIGGIKVMVGDTVWDASIKRRLEELKESLCQ